MLTFSNTNIPWFFMMQFEHRYNRRTATSYSQGRHDATQFPRSTEHAGSSMKGHLADVTLIHADGRRSAMAMKDILSRVDALNDKAVLVLIDNVLKNSLSTVASTRDTPITVLIERVNQGDQAERFADLIKHHLDTNVATSDMTKIGSQTFFVKGRTDEKLVISAYKPVIKANGDDVAGNNYIVLANLCQLVASFSHDTRYFSGINPL